MEGSRIVFRISLPTSKSNARSISLATLMWLVQERISDIKSIVLNGGACTLDELIQTINDKDEIELLMRTSFSRLNRFVQPKYARETFVMSENVIDRLRSLVVELDTRMPMASVALRLNKPEYKGIRETFVQVLGQLKESVEDLEAQSEGFSDKTRRHATTEPIDFTILSVNKMKTLTKKLVSISNIPEYKGENANNTKVISQQSAKN